MALKKIKCPCCGSETLADTSKDKAFCSNCGSMIQIEMPRAEENHAEEKRENLQLEKSLKEVKFYQDLSIEKDEARFQDKDPEYYLKAQDILVDLSEQYPDDFRIWWELCKPLDFYCPGEGTTASKINTYHFDKALRLADLETKKELVRYRDEYEDKKKSVEESKHLAEMEEAAKMQAVIEAEENKRREEERKKAEVLAKERQEAERQKAERQEAERREAERLEKERAQIAAEKKEKDAEKRPALLSLILMIVSWVGMILVVPAIICPPISIVFGIKGLKRSNRGKAIAGIIGSALIYVLLIIILIVEN